MVEEQILWFFFVFRWLRNEFFGLSSFLRYLGTNKFVFLHSFDSPGTNIFVFLRFNPKKIRLRFYFAFVLHVYYRRLLFPFILAHFLPHEFVFLWTPALLQGLRWFSVTQTGCRWLISYMEQKKLLACEPEFSVEFSAPPEFFGSVMEKCLRTGANLRPSDYEQGVLPLRHCYHVCKKKWQSFCFLLGFSGRFCSYRKPNFPAVSGSYLPGFPALSAVTGNRIFRPYQVVTCRNFPAVSAVTGSRIFRPYL